jgi:hypothetical protein
MGAYRWSQNSDNIIDRHSRSASGRESSGDDEKQKLISLPFILMHRGARPGQGGLIKLSAKQSGELNMKLYMTS